MIKSEKKVWNITFSHYLCTYLSTKLVKYGKKQIIKGINFGIGGWRRADHPCFIIRLHYHPILCIGLGLRHQRQVPHKAQQGSKNLHNHKGGII